MPSYYLAPCCNIIPRAHAFLVRNYRHTGLWIACLLTVANSQQECVVEILALGIACANNDGDYCNAQGDCKQTFNDMATVSECSDFWSPLELSCCAKRVVNSSTPCDMFDDSACLQATRDVAGSSNIDAKLKKDAQDILDQCVPFPVAVVIAVVLVLVAVVAGSVVGIIYFVRRRQLGGGSEDYGLMDSKDGA